jgi:hypothetical protein
MKTIEEKDISEYLFNGLMLKGHVPEQYILDDLAEVIYDFLLHNGLIKYT